MPQYVFSIFIVYPQCILIRHAVKSHMGQEGQAEKLGGCYVGICKFWESLLCLSLQFRESSEPELILEPQKTHLAPKIYAFFLHRGSIKSDFPCGPLQYDLSPPNTPSSRKEESMVQA